MAINKVIYGNDTLIDLTDSTVNPTNLLAGEKAYGADGEPVFGTLELGSTINITAIDSEFFGEDVTLSDGVTTLITVFDNQGEATFSSVILTGLLTITCKGLSQTISIQTYGTYNVTFDPVPEGATITPVNSIPIWLRCAHITDKDYTTLAEVLADRETFDILLRDSNACDYMARSTEWAGDPTVKVPKMTSATAPSGQVVTDATLQNPYWGYYVFDQNESTFANPKVNNYIGYMFTSSVVVNSLKLMNGDYRENYINTFKVQGSNTGGANDWHDITGVIQNTNLTQKGWSYYTFENDIAYKYYALRLISSTGQPSVVYCNIGEIQFYNWGITTNQDAMALIGKYDYACNALLKNDVWAEALLKSEYRDEIFDIQVPKMTSNTAPSGTCFAGSIYSSTYDAYKAFDKDNSTRWNSNSSIPNELIGYTFVEPVIIKGIKIRNYQVYTCKIQGSNDGTNWTDLTDVLDITSTVNGDDYYFTIDNNTKYSRYCIRCLTSQQGNVNFSIYEIQFYGRSSKATYKGLVPTMTGATTPSGEVFSSGDYSGQPAWKAFDGDNSTSWSADGPYLTGGAYIGYKFPEAVKVNALGYIQRWNALPSGVTQTFYVQGSNTGQSNDWITLSATFSVTHTNNTDKAWHYIDFENDNEYLFYRVCEASNSNSGLYPTFMELQFCQRTVNTNIIHSAANDTIYYLDENEEPVVIATTNSDGDGICDFSLLEDKIYRLYSTVAKDPDNLSNPYSKRVRITKSDFGGTTELYLMPDTVRTLYWWGYENNIESMVTGNGWSRSNYTFNAPTYNTNYVDCYGNGNQVISGVSSTYKPTLMNRMCTIAQGVTAVNSSYGNIKAEPSKAVDGSSATRQTLYDANTLKFYDNINPISDNYFTSYAIANRRYNLYGMWYE